ncbi:MAG: HDOD domain-containing protein [Candidatus Kapaibacterium sp.]
MNLIETLIETQEFATLPPIAARVLKLLEDDNINIRDIAKVIEADASLTLKLLRVANSPLYATRTEINSIHQAIITLGLSRLTNIVLGVSIFSKFLLSSQKQAADLMEKFWWHSSCTGMVAKSVARKINRYFKENEFIGGLIHDIGKLAMLQYDSVKYKQVVELIENNGMLDDEAEREVFGATHVEVGSEIARLWKLPSELTAIIQHHDKPHESENHKELVACVRLADLMCEMWGADFYEGIKTLDVEDEVAWHVLTNSYPDLKDLDVEVFTFELESEFRRSSVFLNLLVSEAE